jgi:uncharacterized membrane protein
MDTNKTKYISLLIWIVAFLIISSSIGLLSMGEFDVWYQTLQRFTTDSS